MNTKQLAGALMLVTAATLVATAAPPQANHDEHLAMQKRGEKAMGFDQTQTLHHFRLLPKGGAIEVRVKNPADLELRGQVVAHLRTIAEQFARGDFSAPFAVHAADPAGVPALKLFRDEIAYTFVADDTGGRVVISAGSKQSIAAVHEFLRYQIREHRTGDSLKVGGR